MSIVPSRGPVVTYVTDEDLDIDDQQRILRAYVACAPMYSLRVAFRLPKWPEAKVLELFEWYLRWVEDTGVQAALARPLVHDRPEVVDRYPDAGLWLPWRNRDLMQEKSRNYLALSVHSIEQVEEAITLGVSEVLFGHVFVSETHPGDPGKGVSALLAVNEVIQGAPGRPYLTAIGGMNQYTVPEIGRHHLERVAAMRAISQSPDIALTLRHLQQNWQAAWLSACLDEEQRSPFGRPSSVFF